MHTVTTRDRTEAVARPQVGAPQGLGTPLLLPTQCTMTASSAPACGWATSPLTYSMEVASESA